jgi:uncharacterized protein YjiS (DUF1127 family)
MCQQQLLRRSRPILPRAGLLTRLLRWAAACRARSRERQWLAQMNSAQLKDIGLTRWEALREAEKPFWRP